MKNTYFMLKKFLVLILFLTIGYSAVAGGYDPTPNPEDVPLDGGVSVLIALGVAYAGKKYRDFKKNQSQKDIDNVL